MGFQPVQRRGERDLRGAARDRPRLRSLHQCTANTPAARLSGYDQSGEHRDWTRNVQGGDDVRRHSADDMPIQFRDRGDGTLIALKRGQTRGNRVRVSGVPKLAQ